MPDPPVVRIVASGSEPARRWAERLRVRGYEVRVSSPDVAPPHAMEEGPIDAVVLEAEGPEAADAWLAAARDAGLDPVVVAVVPRRAAESAPGEPAATVTLDDPSPETLEAVLALALERRALARHVGELERRLETRHDFGRLVGGSRAWLRVLDQARAVAATRTSVLLVGEAGTGKDALAQAIHQQSPRARGSFVRVDAAAADVESVLFGTAASSGDRTVPGAIEAAAGGSLYLDEVAALPAAVQVRLLHALRDRAFEPSEGGGPRKVDVRLLASTREDLAAAAGDGRFRADLLERLATVRIVLPPLRERPEDVPALVDAFLREGSRRPPRVTAAALERLLRHRWPGNVRELETTIRAMAAGARAGSRLDASDLPRPLRAAARGGRLEVGVGMTVEEMERRLIQATLAHTGQDKARAAALLGIGLRTLYRKLGENRGR